MSSARVVRCWVKSRNERNPLFLVASGKAGHTRETAVDNTEEGGDDVKSSCPLCLGQHTCYNGSTRGSETARWSKSQKSCPSSDCSLQLDYMKLESLVIADQHAAVNTFPGLVHKNRPVTPRSFERRPTSVTHQKGRDKPYGEISYWGRSRSCR